MNKSIEGFPAVVEGSRSLRIGFIPDTDCAPIVAAHESGLFEKYELRVELSRENGWANIRDRILYGELDAAHAPASLPFVANLGVDSDRSACVTGLVLSLQGNAIVISPQLWGEGVRDAKTLRDLIYRSRGKRTYTFGVVFPHSPPYFLLRQWLKSGGIDPEMEVRLVVLSPAQMFPTLKLGYIDGYCVGEPWTSLTLDAQAGVCVATSADLAPLHPEKVLMVRRSFAEDRANEHERLIAALLEACAFCDQPENHTVLAGMLAQPRYVNAPIDCLKHGLGSGDCEGAKGGDFAGLNIFHRYQANDPTNEKAVWLVSRLYDLMEESVLRIPPMGRTPVLKNIFRRDIFERAKAVMVHQKQALTAEAERYEARIERIA